MKVPFRLILMRHHAPQSFTYAPRPSMSARGSLGGGPLGHLTQFLSHHRDALWSVFLYAGALGLLGLATPIAVQALVNTAAFGSVLQPIVVLSAVVFTVLVVMGIIKALKSWVVEVLQRRTFAESVARIGYVLPRRADGAAGDLVEPTHRFFEIFSVHKATASLLLGGVDATLAALVGLLVLAFYHPLLLAFDVALILAIVLIVFGLGRGGVRTAIAESSAKYDVASFLSELERTRLAFRDAAGERFAHAQLDALCGAYLHARSRHFRVVLRQLIGALATQALASAVLLGLGGFLVFSRELTLGQLVAAELIVTAVVSALSDLGKHLETYYDLVAGVYKLDQVQDLPVEPEQNELGSEEVGSGPARLALFDLKLGFGARTLIERASLELPAGARVRLAGPPESGKTALLELLYGLVRQSAGAVMLDGADTRELSRAALRRRIALVRGPEIVPGSILDNVRLGDAAVGSGAVRAVLDQLGLLGELAHLPDGLDTRVGKGGMPLSYSQALRVTLARALVRRPGLVALDADFSAMGDSAVDAVLSVLTRPAAPWTVIVVGEGPRLARVTGHVLTLADGKLSLGVSS
jgi:putative ABC transport system ATP-binding protein